MLCGYFGTTLVFPQVCWTRSFNSGSSALQAYIMAHTNYFTRCTRGYDRCVNTKKELKFWNRGRNLQRSADGRKYCYAPNLSCYLLRTSTSHFKERHFYGEITVSLLHHWKAPVFMQQLAPSETKILIVLRDPVERYIAIMRKAGISRERARDIAHQGISEWHICVKSFSDVYCAYTFMSQRGSTSYLVSSLYFLFLHNWLSHLPMSRFIFVSASRLRCEAHILMPSLFKQLGVQGAFDTKILDLNINVNNNPLEQDSRGYGGHSAVLKKSTRLGMSASSSAKSGNCTSHSNRFWLDDTVVQTLEDFYRPFSLKLARMLNSGESLYWWPRDIIEFGGTRALRASRNLWKICRGAVAGSITEAPSAP